MGIVRHAGAGIGNFLENVRTKVSETSHYEIIHRPHPPRPGYPDQGHAGSPTTGMKPANRWRWLIAVGWAMLGIGAVVWVYSFGIGSGKARNQSMAANVEAAKTSASSDHRPAENATHGGKIRVPRIRTTANSHVEFSPRKDSPGYVSPSVVSLLSEMAKSEARIAIKLSGTGLVDQHRLSPSQCKEATLAVGKTILAVQDWASNNMILKEEVEVAGGGWKYRYAIGADAESVGTIMDDLASELRKIGGDAFASDAAKSIRGWQELIGCGERDVSIWITPGHLRKNGEPVSSRVTVNFLSPENGKLVDYYSTTYSSLARTTRLFEVRPEEAAFDKHPTARAVR